MTGRDERRMPRKKARGPDATRAGGSGDDFASYVWRLIGTLRSEAGWLDLTAGRLRYTTETREVFDVSLDEVTDVVWPWYYFGGGVKLTADGEQYRFSFVLPTARSTRRRACRRPPATLPRSRSSRRRAATSRAAARQARSGGGGSRESAPPPPRRSRRADGPSLLGLPGSGPLPVQLRCRAGTRRKDSRGAGRRARGGRSVLSPFAPHRHRSPVLRHTRVRLGVALVIALVCLAAASLLPAVAMAGGWTSQTSGTSQSFRAVDFTDASHGWAVGEAGMVRATINGGTTWSAQTSGTAQEFYGVAFGDSDARLGRR